MSKKPLSLDGLDPFRNDSLSAKGGLLGDGCG